MRHVALLAGLALVASSAAARADADDDVKVKIEGPPDTVLERVIEGTDLWESLCVGSCATPVPRDGLYRIAGPGTRPSLPLSLAPSPDGLVHIKPTFAYTSGFVGGIIMSIVGPLAVLGGSVALATANNNNEEINPPTPCTGNCPPPTQTTSVPSNSQVVGGAIVVGIGLALTIGGIVAVIMSHHTKVEQTALTVSPRSLTFTF